MAEQAAINEIRQQLQSRSDGKVWIDDWRERYWNVSPTPKDLMLRHPDKFTLSFVGSRFTVALVQSPPWKKGAGGAKGAPRTIPPRTIPKRFGQGAPLALAPLPKLVPVQLAKGGKGVVVGGKGGGVGGKSGVVGGKGSVVAGRGVVVQGKGGKWGKGAPSPMAALPALPATDQDAIDEIRKQLANGNGYVWVNDWRRRFGALAATQKEFLETHPEVFLMNWEGKRYTVEYIGMDESEDAAAVDEEDAAQPDADHDDAQPDAEDDVAQPDAEDDAALLGEDDAADAGADDAVATPEKTSLSWPRPKRPLELAKDRLPAKVAKTENGRKEGTMEDVVEEFVRQLRNPRNKEGKVWINDWKWKYGHIGLTPREVLECHPERFEVVPGVGSRFSVRLVDEDV